MDDSPITGREGPSRSIFRAWMRPVVSLLAVLITYYAVPLDWADDHQILALLQTAAGIALLAWAIIGQVRRNVQHPEDGGLPTLATLLALVLVVFAYGYLVLENTRPGEMTGLSTRTDSLYFTLQVLTTVGLGDVHASGQIARALVSVQMVFDVVFVAAAGSLVLSASKTRLTERAGPSRHSSDIDHRRETP